MIFFLGDNSVAAFYNELALAEFPAAAEIYDCFVAVGGSVNELRHDIEHILACVEERGLAFLRRIVSRRKARLLPALGDIIDKVVDVQRIAAGENAVNARHKAAVADGAFSPRVELHSEALRLLILGDKTDREDEPVAFDRLLGAFYRLHFIVDL